MKRSKTLGIVASVLAALAALFGWLAARHYGWASHYYRSAARAQAEVMVPTVLGFICLGGAVLAGLLAIASKEQ